MIYVFYGKNEGLVYYVEPPNSLGSNYIEVKSGDVPKKEGFETIITVDEDNLNPIFKFEEIKEVDQMPKESIEKRLLQMEENEQILSDAMADILDLLMEGDI